MPNFFREFPKVDYRFGDNTSTNRFDNISVYIDIIDQIKDNPAFYEKYSILENERPDQLSNKLYDSPFYHWTFFLLNDGLRESGWPVSNMKVFDLAKKYYPHTTVTTEDEIASLFLVGTRVNGKSSTTTGTVIAKNLDLGQIIIETDGVFLNGEQIEEEDNIERTAVVYSSSDQYLSVHHYEDADGNWVDIDPFNQSSSGLNVSVTYLDRLRAKNDSLREIKVIRPSALASVVGEYKRLLRA